MRAWPVVFVALAGIAQASPARTVGPASSPRSALPTGLRAAIDDDLQLHTHWEWSGRAAAPGATGDARIAERAGRAFIAAHLRDAAPGMGVAEALQSPRSNESGASRTGADELVVVANQLDDTGVRTIGFQQTWRGLDVVGGQIAVVISRDAIIAVLSRVAPCVDAVVATHGPEVGRWLFAHRNDAATNDPTISSADTDLVVLPLQRKGTVRYEIAERRSSASGDIYTALDGRELTRTSRTRDAVATLAYDVPVRGPMGPRAALPAKNTFITIDGTPSITDPNGAFAFFGPGVVVPDVKSTQIVISDQSGTPATTSLQATNLAAVVWADDNELVDAQLSAFIHARIAKDHARVVVPAVTAWANQPLVVSVNETGTSCNANAADDGLHFYRATPECENTARIADVVYHETGHLVHANAIIPGAGVYSAPLSEGLADFFAATITGDHLIAPGYALDDRPVRDIDPVNDEREAPGDLVPEPHLSGLIISGALWDLRKLLIAAHGEADGNARVYRIFASIAARAPNIQGTYLPALVGDDDDGDLENGTPDQCLIDRAFSRHGLAPSTVKLTTVGPPTVDGLAIDVPVSTPASACPQPRVAQMIVTWHGDSESRVFHLYPDESGTHWTGSLPPQPDYARVHYSIDVVFEDGAAQHLPDNRADREYQLVTGTWDEIYCESFDADPQWDQTTQGVPAKWELGKPRGMALDPTAAFTGENVWGTVLSEDGRYAPTSVTQTTSPLIDATSYSQVHLRYRRWLTVEDGAYDQASILVGDAPLWTNDATADGSHDHIDREWRLHDLDVTPYATQPFAITWRLSSDVQRQLGGWNLDDVCIVGAPSQALQPVGPPDSCSAGGTPGASLSFGVIVFALRRRRRRLAS
ncbi:MAG TPA: hypothetical protein VGM39_13465 [Kofleriaceae bacterium]|jgi:hypothetical protein